MSRILLALIALLTLTATAQAEPPKVDDPRFIFDPKDVVPIKAGVTKFDIDGDGLEDFVVKSLRNNHTAHTPSIYTFYRTCRYKNIDDPCWNNIIETIFFKHQIKQRDIYETFWTHIGASGILDDIRVITNKYKTIIVRAKRKYGESYADAKKVTFTVYRLYTYKNDNKSSRYIPPAFWIEDGAYISKGVYVDVGEAFLLELGLPDPEAEKHNYFDKTGGRPPIDQTSKPKKE